jgi:hypothetical protein
LYTLDAAAAFFLGSSDTTGVGRVEVFVHRKRLAHLGVGCARARAFLGTEFFEEK